MQIVINGEPRNIESEFNLRELLEKLELPTERIAIELNKNVIRKKDWETIKINDADKIEIIHFVGGGLFNYELRIANYELRITNCGLSFYNLVRISFARIFVRIKYKFVIRNYLTMSDSFTLAGKTFTSRLIIGTGKYRSNEEMQKAHKASGAEMVTVAVNRVPLDGKTESFLDFLNSEMQILPNTAGCYDAEHAIRTARLAREALETDWIKLEVIGDQVTLLPDNEQTLEAARILVKEGFIVLPYFSDDLIMAKKLLDIGCPAVMPLAAPIGSGMGVQNPSNLRIMREQLPDATIIVDAGVGVPSDAAIAMELGADAILMNTAIAESKNAEMMATAMKLAVQAGRLAYISGRMPKRLYASASSPIEGAIK